MSDKLTQSTIWGFLLLVLIAFRLSHPLNEAEAKIWMEKEGYTDIKVVNTGESCFRGKRVFKFIAVNRSGNNSTGTLCFATVRAFSTVNEKAVNNQLAYDRLSESMEN